MDAGAWLRSLGLEQYEAIFRENAIDETVLPDLTDQDLEKLGVLLGHRRKLLRAIANLQATEKGTPAVAGVEPAAPMPVAQDTQGNVLAEDTQGKVRQSVSPNYQFRLGRLPYFLFTVLVFAFVVLIAVSAPQLKGLAAVLIFSIAIFILAVGRVHDFGYSAWYALLLFVPAIGLVFWLYSFFPESAEVPGPMEATASAGTGIRVLHYRLGMGTIVATAGSFAEVKFDRKASIRRVPMKQLQIVSKPVDTD